MNNESREAVLLAMVQALSFKYGCDCLGNENDRRYLASMGPEEKFKAMQIEFIALAYRIETREMELRAAMTKLLETETECATLRRLLSVESRKAYNEEVIAKFTRTHTAEVIEMHIMLERDRQKLKTAINADLMQHIPAPQAVKLDDILTAAGIKPKDTSTRSRLHTLLAEHREKFKFYPVEEAEAMALKVKKFANDNDKLFQSVKPVPLLQSVTLPWESNVGGGKRKHPVDKVWDAALDSRPAKK
jgi:hypothetical protein